jgi:hypothetical protein
VQIRRIAPEDVPALPERVGKMVFDKVMMKWVKATALAVAGVNEENLKEHTGGTEGESEDPFRDIESLREDDSGMSVEGAMGRIDERFEDEEEMELMSFSFDGSSAVVQVMTGVETDDMGDQTTDSEDEVEPTGERDEGFVSEDDVQHADRASPQRPVSMALLVANFGTPQPAQGGPSTAPATPVIRSALKSSSATPVSALKDPQGKYQTPVGKHGHHHRRSVSFSDGKRDGPIRGLGRTTDGGSGGGVGFVPSARSKRIADMMVDLEESGEWVGFEMYSVADVGLDGRF